MIAGPLSDVTPSWHYAFVVTHCVWLGCQFALIRPRGGSGPATLPKLSRPLLVIPAGLLLAMATVYAGIGAYIPAPPTVALSGAMALIWGGMALQVWTVRREVLALAATAAQSRQRLLSTGPYRISNNPAETGGFVTLIGIALGFGTTLAVALISVAGAIAFVALVARRAPLPPQPRTSCRWRLIPFVW